MTQDELDIGIDALWRKITAIDGGTPLPVISLSTASVVHNEGGSGNTAYTFNVVRSGLTTWPSKASSVVSGYGGRPANAADFGGTFPSGTVNFVASDTAETITVNVSGDATAEATERFLLSLFSPINADLSGSAAIGTISDDDSSALVEPNSTNAGDLTGGTYTAYTTKLITTDNTVLTKKHISGGVLLVRANNVTIQNCLVDGPTDDFSIDCEGAVGTIIQNNTMVGPSNGLGNSAVLTGTNAVVLNNDISQWQNGLALQDGTQTIKGNFIHDLGPPSGGAGDAHVDGIGCQGGQNGVLIEGNSVRSWDTSCLFISADFGSGRDIAVIHNWLRSQGGGRQTSYPLYMGYVLGYLQVTDNFIEEGADGYASTYGDLSQLVWENNLDIPANTLIPSP